MTAASHMLGWGAENGGGTDSDASRPSRATDVQTLIGMQDSGAIDRGISIKINEVGIFLDLSCR